MKTLRQSPGLSRAIKFQQVLALAASTSNPFEAEAAELAARRLMETQNIDPVTIPDVSLYNGMNFANNALLKKLRDEWRAAHPHYSYKTRKDGVTRRLRGKPKPVNTKRKPTPVNMYEGMFDDFAEAVNTKPKAKAESAKHQTQ
jgi:hypothetical protein